VTATQVRTTALWARSAQFMYHFTYAFCGFGGMRRCLAVPKAKRADISSVVKDKLSGCRSMTRNLQTDDRRDFEGTQKDKDTRNLKYGYSEAIIRYIILQRDLMMDLCSICILHAVQLQLPCPHRIVVA